MAKPIIRREGPNSWRIVVRPRGMREINRTIHGTEADAHAEAARMARQAEQLGAPPVRATIQIGTWLERIIRLHRDWQPNTRRIYREFLRLYIDPQTDTADRQWNLGASRLNRLTAADGNTFIAWLLDERGVSAHTARDVVRFVKLGLRQAVAEGVIGANPWQDVIAPRVGLPRVSVPDRQSVLRAADIPNARDRLAVMLSVATGIRRGEALALTWRDVDLRSDPPTITVNAALEQQRGQPPQLKDPKTATSRRPVTLPQMVLPELRAARLASNNLAVATGRDPDTMPVLADHDGGWWSPEAASQSVRRAMAAAGIPGSWHSLRHAHATQLLQVGISPHQVARRLGHARVTTTLVTYAHAMPTDDGTLARVTDEILTAQPLRRVRPA